MRGSPAPLAYRFFTFLFVFFFLGINLSFADDLSISQYPTNPKVGENVTITLSSDKYNLNLSNITWTVDGEEVDSGTGRKTLIISTNIEGKTQVVSAKVSQEGFNDSEVQLFLEANTNFLLYEGVDSYVPSFYKGRRLPAKEGTAKVAFFSFKNNEVAGFKGSSVENYYWKVQGQDKSELSGPNRIVNNIIAKTTDNSLQINTIKEDINGNRRDNQVLIPLQNTETILYKTDEKKLTRQPISETEMGKKMFVLVEPFFFSVASKKDSDLIYKWKINDVLQKLETPWSVVFAGKEADSVKINLNLENNKKITQESEKGFTFRIQ